MDIFKKIEKLNQTEVLEIAKKTLQLDLEFRGIAIMIKCLIRSNELKREGKWIG